MATFLDVSQQAMVWRQLLLDDLKAALELKEHGVDVQFLVDNIKRKHRCLNYLFQQWTGEDEFFIVQHLFEDGGLDVEESSSFEKIDPFSTIELHEYAALLMEEMANDVYRGEQGDIDIPDEIVIGESDEFFGDKVYAETIDDTDVPLNDHSIEDESFDNEDNAAEHTDNEEAPHVEEDHGDFDDDGLFGFDGSDITRETEETDEEPLAPSEPVLEPDEVTDEQGDQQPAETASSGIGLFVDALYEEASTDTLSRLLEPYVDNSVPVQDEVVVEETAPFELNDETEEESPSEGEEETTTDEVENEVDESEEDDTADFSIHDEEDQIPESSHEQDPPEIDLTDDELEQLEQERLEQMEQDHFGDEEDDAIE